MELEEAKEIVKSIVKVNNEYLKNVNNQTINQREIKAIEVVLQALENSILKEAIVKKRNELDKELEQKYSAEKISIFSENTYMEKFKLLGKREILQELLER